MGALCFSSSNATRKVENRQKSLAGNLLGSGENASESIRSSKTDLKGDKFTFVIVGFGVAGGYAAQKLAELGVKDFEVAIVGEEPTFAYERS